MIAPPFTAAFGKGGIDNRNVIQKLHAPKDLEKAHEHEVWSGVMEIERRISEGEDLEDMDVQDVVDNARPTKARGFPTTTRWNAVGPAAQREQDDGDLVDAVARAVLNRDATDKASNKIASGVVSLN